MVPRWLDLPVWSVAPEINSLTSFALELLGTPQPESWDRSMLDLDPPPFPPSRIRSIRLHFVRHFANISEMENPPHPLASLSIDETNTARDVVLSCHPDTVIGFRMISLQEPAKAELIHFLELEHSGNLSPNTPRPRRLAKINYDVIDESKAPKYMESIVDIETKERVSAELISSDVHACLTV